MTGEGESAYVSPQGWTSRGRISQAAWLPVPLLMLAILAVWATGSQQPAPQPWLTWLSHRAVPVLWLFVIVIPSARTFLASTRVCVLMLGCGVLVLQLAMALPPTDFADRPNTTYAIYNTGALLSAVLHFIGVIIAGQGGRRIGSPAAWLAAAYAGAVGLMLLVAWLAYGGRVPAFFVPGEGGTPLRSLVVGASIALFLLTAAMLWRTNRRFPSAFHHWYALGLMLVAVHLTGSLLLKQLDTPLHWLTRGTVVLGAIYLCVAVIASARENGFWLIPSHFTLAAALRESEERFRSLFNSMDEAFVVKEMITGPDGRGTDFRFLETNPAFERQSGLQNVVGRTMREVMPDMEPSWIERYAQVVRTGEPVRFQDCVRTLDRWFDVYAWRPGEAGSRRVAIVFSDVTERKRAERELLETSERFRTVLEQSLDVAYRRDLQSNRLDYISPVCEQVLGFSADEMRGMSLNEVLSRIHPDDHGVIETAFTKAAQTGSARFECRWLRKDGEWCWIADYAFVVKDREGRPLYRGGVIRDITEQKRAEALLRENEQKLRVALDAAQLGTWTIDFDGHRWQLDERAQRLYGLSSPDAIHDESHLRGLIHDEDLPGIREALARACDPSGHGRYEAQYRVCLPGGDERWISAWARVEFEGEGERRKPVRMIGSSRDISGQKWAEEALRKSEESFRVAQELSLDAFTVLSSVRDEDGRIVDFRWEYVNPEAGRVLKHAPAELVGRRLLAVLPGNKANCDLFDRYVRVAETGDPHDYELLYESEGIQGWFRNMTVKLGDGIAVCFTDITERKRAEAALAAAKEAAEAANTAKDQFLAVLSHELRTPLTPVLMVSQQMEMDSSLPAQIREDMKTIRQNVQMETRLIDDLLDLTRIARGKITLKPQPVDVHDILRHALDACCDERFSERQLRIEWKLRASPSVVSADPVRLQQVCWNLIGNAVKFTPPGGTITLSTSNLPAGQVCIQVSDTGKGIEPDKLANVLDPFEQGGTRTTRRYGGLGLGLAISRAIMQMHGGAITAASDGVGRGATFTVTLAMAEPQPAAAPVAVAGTSTVLAPEPASSPRILLVEDHQATSLVLQRFMKKWGWEVLPASSVKSALELAATRPFDLVISDLGLPDGDGHGLMRQLRDQHGLKGVALSGYGMDKDMQESLASGFVAHFVKPFSFDDLRNAVTAFLAGANQARTR
ncbi:MAG: hypothetical protein AMXMBFR13_10830 [Phycisphaerae bacterium]